MAAGRRPRAWSTPGYYAIESLRLEKGYRAFGRELTPDYNPVEAGLLFACKLSTDIELPRPGGGREGEGGRARAAARLARRSTDPGAMMWGGELVLRDGVAAGQVTSARLGRDHRRVGRPGLRPPPGRRRGDADYLRAGTYQVNVGGDIHPATVHLRPPYDPAGTRVRGPQ